jgi:hypothetical protein
MGGCSGDKATAGGRGEMTLTAENGVKESQEESTKAGVLNASLGEFFWLMRGLHCTRATASWGRGARVREEEEDGGGGGTRGTGVREKSALELRGECKRTMILREAESREPEARAFTCGRAGGGVEGGWEVKRCSGKGDAALLCMIMKGCDGNQAMLKMYTLRLVDFVRKNGWGGGEQAADGTGRRLRVGRSLGCLIGK